MLKDGCAKIFGYDALFQTTPYFTHYWGDISVSLRDC